VSAFLFSTRDGLLRGFFSLYIRCKMKSDSAVVFHLSEGKGIQKSEDLKPCCKSKSDTAVAVTLQPRDTAVAKWNKRHRCRLFLKGCQISDKVFKSSTAGTFDTVQY
jgi:hypothetical protein